MLFQEAFLLPPAGRLCEKGQILDEVRLPVPCSNWRIPRKLSGATSGHEPAQFDSPVLPRNRILTLSVRLLRVVLLRAAVAKRCNTITCQVPFWNGPH